MKSIWPCCRFIYQGCMSNIMKCNECCKELIGWVKSFTRLERALSVLQAALLAVLVALLLLLVLHLIVCSSGDVSADIRDTTTSGAHATDNAEIGGYRVVSEPGQPMISNTSATHHKTRENNTNSRPEAASEGATEPGVKCSWTPSAKTTAAHHYYEDGATPAANRHTNTQASNSAAMPVQPTTLAATVPSETLESESYSTSATFEDLEELIRAEQSDGEEAEMEYGSYVAALVKPRPPRDVIFGCMLTIVSEYCTLTAASCLEAIEETESLDSFLVMPQYGTAAPGALLAVEDVLVHPLYEGRNRSYDLAVLRSAGTLTRPAGAGAPIQLATYLDYALFTLAQRFLLLGYGAFRSMERRGTGRVLRAANVYLVSGRQCAGGGGGAALRHLSAGRPAERGGCAARALCAGVLHSRALPCNYCAGAPLVAASGARRLVALRSDWAQCGEGCEPALYVNLPDVARWILAAIDNDDSIA